jgi:hypothetical protein
VSAGKVVAGGAVGVALGTVLGFFVLAPNIEGGPDRVVGDSRDELKQVTAERDTASAENDAADGVIAAAAPDLVRDALKDRPVLVVSTADADQNAVQATRSILDASGAVNAGDIRLTEAFTDQDSGDELKTIAANSLPAKAKLSEDRRDPGYHVGELLGQALGEGRDGAAASDSDRGLALGALEKGGFIEYDPDSVRPAAAVVVVTGDDDGGGDKGSYATRVVADLATAMDSTTGGVVLSGGRDAASAGGALGLVRGDKAETAAVSTVDNGDRAAGRVTVVRALVEQLDGKAGSYGTAANAASATVKQ